MNAELVLPLDDAADPAGEHELVARAAGGDAAAFDELVALHHAGLVRLARFVLASDLEAEDVVQECWALAWERLGGLRRHERFLSWLRRILVRHAVHLARRRRRERDLAGEHARSGPVATEAAGTSGLDVAAALARLTPRQRAVFLLTEVEGWSSSEAARHLGMAAATVRVHRLLARRRLRELFARREP